MFQIKKSARVYSADNEELGKVDRIVIDPLTSEVTHVVVRKGLLFPEDKVIATESIATATEDRINLHQDLELDDLPPFVEHHYLPPAEGELEVEYELPTMVWFGPYASMTPMFKSAMRTVAERNIPERTAAIEPGTEVRAKGRRDVGEFEEVVMTDDGLVTHIVIREPGLSRTRKAIPIHWIEAMTEDEILLGTTERMVESVEPYDPADLSSVS